MNTTQTSASPRFASIKSLGRGIAVASAVALGGITTLSAADASAAGVATGVRYAGASATPTVASAATSLPGDATSVYRIRDGRITRI